MSKKLGLILAAGLLVAGCGVGSVPARDTGSVSVPETPTSASATPTSAPATTEAPTTPVVTTAPAAVTTTAPEPQTTAQAAPDPGDCGTGYYRNSDGNCVHRPGDNPSGATAQCKDGTYSYSRHRSGTCSGHGGVRTWL